MKWLLLFALTLAAFLISGCQPDQLELRARNLGSEEISDTSCEFAGNYFKWGWLVKNADARAHLYGTVRYKGTECKVQFRRANGQLIEKTIDVSDKVEWLKTNCKGKRGVQVIVKFLPEKEAVDIEVSCKD